MVEPRVSRRTALATAAVAVAVTGCGPEGDGSPVPEAGGSADQGVDLRLLREALRREQQLEDKVVSLRRDRAGLRTPLRQAAAVHREHLDLLRRSVAEDGDDEVTLSRRRARREPPPAVQVRRLAAAERRLAQAHADAALEARSGPFARVLAGMAAAADQQALALDSLAAAGPGRG